jgi:carboxyl-terminal processing protease
MEIENPAEGVNAVLTLRVRSAVAAVSLSMLGLIGLGIGDSMTAVGSSRAVPRCAPFAPQDVGKREGPASVSTVQQAYECLLANYGGSAALSPARLAAAAMGGIVGYLARHHKDSMAAVLPALEGAAGSDWRAFARAFAAITSRGRDQRSQTAPLAVAAIGAMVGSLHDDHTSYMPAGQLPPGAPQADLGIYVRIVQPPSAAAGEAAMVVDDLDPTGPAASAGVRVGDVITSVDRRPVPLPTVSGPRSPAFDLAARVWTPAELGWIPMHADSVTLSIWRPSVRRRLFVVIQPAFSTYNGAAMALAGGVAYVRIHGFLTPSTGSQAVAELRALHPSHGVIVDLRGNTGGNPQALATLLGAFVHNRVLAINVGRAGQRRRLYANNSVELIHQPLAVLVDGGSMSAAEAAAADVRDLHLGVLVGARTAGVIAGAGIPFVLNDRSVLTIDTAAAFGPDGEIIDGIGVPVDDSAPLPTPTQLSDGHDPAITAALRALTGAHARTR